MSLVKDQSSLSFAKTPAVSSDLKVLMITEALDRESPHLAFAGGWCKALAEKSQKVFIAACFVHKFESTGNIQVLPTRQGQEYSGHGEGFLKRCLQIGMLWKAVLGCLLFEKVDVIFAHMNPLFVLMAAPVAKLKKIPILFWYARGGVYKRLKSAVMCSTYVMTASPESCRIESRKLKVIGHGIDTDYFCPSVPSIPGASGTPRVILTVGRIAPIKRCDLILQAFIELKNKPWFSGVKLVFCGDIVYKLDQEYLNELKKTAEKAGLSSQVEFRGRIPYEDIVRTYQSCDLFVNSTSPGSVDKAVLEAMACAKPVVTTNSAFQRVLSGESEHLFVAREDPSLYALKIAEMMELSPQKRLEIGARLRDKVCSEHSLSGWANETVALMESAVFSKK